MQQLGRRHFGLWCHQKEPHSPVWKSAPGMSCHKQTLLLTVLPFLSWNCRCFKCFDLLWFLFTFEVVGANCLEHLVGSREAAWQAGEGAAWWVTWKNWGLWDRTFVSWVFSWSSLGLKKDACVPELGLWWKCIQCLGLCENFCLSVKNSLLNMNRRTSYNCLFSFCITFTISLW